MSVIAFSKRFAVRLLVVLAIANAGAFAAGRMVGWWAAAEESGIIENTQILVLAISLAAALLASWRSGHVLSVAMGGWAAISLLAIQREVDFGMFGGDHWFHSLRSDTVRLAFWLPVVSGLMFLAAPYRHSILHALKAVRWRHIWPALLIGALMLGSELTETALGAGYMRGSRDVLLFVEEVLELNAYFIIAAAAFAILARVSRSASPEAVAARNSLQPAG